MFMFGVFFSYGKFFLNQPNLQNFDFISKYGCPELKIRKLFYLHLLFPEILVVSKLTICDNKCALFTVFLLTRY